ncbi:MAG: 3-dehydroquinate synthase [Candidatus Omnitrophota bacterium]|nr:3-dehydroquinate synthase [Candidatus Omnitrophota bacterium]
MRIIKVNLGKRSYNIIIGNGAIRLLNRYIVKLDIGCDAYIITNPLLKNKFGNLLSSQLKSGGFNIRFKTISDTEKSKSLKEAFCIIKDLAKYGLKRRVFIIALGGGVVGDLAGFVASIYKRGVPYIQLPTTLLAQVDSSIGGKTAVDLAEGKNLVGAFYQPRLVISDTMFLSSLPQRQLCCGLSETIKYAIIKDPQLFFYLEKNCKDIILRKGPALEYVIQRASFIKSEIVQRDERDEKGLRLILNFGHTIGHAIEAASDFKYYNHGEAVALGMLVALDISRKLCSLSNLTSKRIEALIKAVGLPIQIKRINLDDIINAHYHDKKFTGKKNRFVLIKGLGRTRIVENVPLEMIKEAILRRMNC